MSSLPLALVSEPHHAEPSAAPSVTSIDVPLDQPAAWKEFSPLQIGQTGPDEPAWESAPFATRRPREVQDPGLIRAYLVRSGANSLPLHGAQSSNHHISLQGEGCALRGPALTRSVARLCGEELSLAITKGATVIIVYAGSVYLSLGLNVLPIPPNEVAYACTLDKQTRRADPRCRESSG